MHKPAQEVILDKTTLSTLDDSSDNQVGGVVERAPWLQQLWANKKLGISDVRSNSLLQILTLRKHSFSAKDETKRHLLGKRCGALKVSYTYFAFLFSNEWQGGELNGVTSAGFEEFLADVSCGVEIDDEFETMVSSLVGK